MFLDLQEQKYVVWCEGELDALLLYSLGYPSLTLTNGIGAVEREEMYKAITNSLTEVGVSRIYVGVDNDPASYRKGLRLINKLREDGFTAYRLDFDAKDLGELWKNDHSSIDRLLEEHFATHRSDHR